MNCKRTEPASVLAVPLKLRLSRLEAVEGNVLENVHVARSITLSFGSLLYWIKPPAQRRTGAYGVQSGFSQRNRRIGPQPHLTTSSMNSYTKNPLSVSAISLHKPETGSVSMLTFSCAHS